MCVYFIRKEKKSSEGNVGLYSYFFYLFFNGELMLMYVEYESIFLNNQRFTAYIS